MRITATVTKPEPPSAAPKEQPSAATTAAAAAEPATKDQKLASGVTDVSDRDSLPAESTEVDLSNVEIVEKVPTKISSVMASGIAFIRNIAPDIVDNLVVGETPIIPIAVEMIEWAEGNILAGKLTGPEKKRIVINILLWLVDNQEDVFGKNLDYDKDQLKQIVQHVLPSMIDMIIAATKGQILVNKFAKTSLMCLGICCPKQ